MESLVTVESPAPAPARDTARKHTPAFKAWLSAVGSMPWALSVRIGREVSRLMREARADTAKGHEASRILTEYRASVPAADSLAEVLTDLGYTLSDDVKGAQFRGEVKRSEGTIPVSTRLYTRSTDTRADASLYRAIERDASKAREYLDRLAR